MDSTAKEYKPDKLNLQCDKVLNSISNIYSTKEKISVLEQVLDYLRMDLAYEEMRKMSKNEILKIT